MKTDLDKTAVTTGFRVAEELPCAAAQHTHTKIYIFAVDAARGDDPPYLQLYGIIPVPAYALSVSVSSLSCSYSMGFLML